MVLLTNQPVTTKHDLSNLCNFCRAASTLPEWWFNIKKRLFFFSRDATFLLWALNCLRKHSRVGFVGTILGFVVWPRNFLFSESSSSSSKSAASVQLFRPTDDSAAKKASAAFYLSRNCWFCDWRRRRKKKLKKKNSNFFLDKSSFQI